MQVKKLNSNDQQALTELIDITEANLRDKVFWYPISDTSREHFLDDKWTNFFGIFDQNKLIAAAGLLLKISAAALSAVNVGPRRNRGKK